MLRAVLLLITLFAPLARAQGQNPTGPSLPALNPKTTVIGTIRDTTAEGQDLPEAASLSPNGRLVAYATRNDLRIWSVASHSATVLFAGPVSTFTWGPKGDVIAFSRIDRQQSDKFLWAIRLDPLTGKEVEAARRVGLGAIRYAPRFSPDQKFIAYPRQGAERYTYDLAVVPANGGVERVLATGIDLGVQGWTSDGSSIYYRTWPDRTRPARFRVSVAGGTPVRLAEVRPVSTDRSWAYFDPSTGVRVATLAFPESLSVTDWSGSHQLVATREARPRGLKVVNLADGQVRELVDTTGEVGPPVWFADGQRLAFFERKNDRIFLSILRVDGSGSRSLPLTLPPPSLYDPFGGKHAQPSPDGRYAAFVASTNNDVEVLEVLDLTSGSQRSVVELPADATAPEGKGIGPVAWTSDSKRIRYLYGIWAPELRSVHEVTLDGSDKLVRALPRSTYPQPVAVFPSSSSSAPMIEANAVELFGESSLTLVPLDGGAERVIHHGSVIGAGALSPDRQTFAVRAGAFLSGEPTRMITLVSTATANQREIRLPFAEVPGIIWHPDGSRLFLRGRDAAGAPLNLYSVPVDGGAPKKVASIGSRREEGAIAVSPNGTMVAFTGAANATTTFVRLDFDVASLVKAGSRK